MPAVMVAPATCSVAPPLPLTVIVERNVRSCVEAATVVTHGELWSLVAGPGPSLPALADTKTPAA